MKTKTIGHPVGATSEQKGQGNAAPPSRERDAYSLAEFCKRAGIGRTLAYRLLNDGVILSVYARGRRLIPATECTCWLQRLSNKGGAK